MAQTNASNPNAYATADDALARYDARLWGDLCGDVGVRYTADQLKDRSIAPGQRLVAMLGDASFDVESACLRGGRYARDDLANMAGVALNGLISLVVDRAIVRGMRARNPTGPTTDLSKETEEQLKRLREGDDVFGLAETIAAGEGSTTVFPPNAQPGPRRLLSDEAERFFGCRSYKAPPG